MGKLENSSFETKAPERRWVRAGALARYFDVARIIGFDPAPLLKRAGVTRDMLADPELTIPLRSVLSLLEESAQSSGYENFGLRMAAFRGLSDFGPVSLLLEHQPTLRSMLNVLQDYQHLMNRSLALHVEEANELVILREDHILEQDRVMRQSVELALGVLFKLIESVATPDWRPYAIQFAHDPPGDLSFHRRFFRRAPEFNAEFNGIVLEAKDLDLPNPAANERIALYAKRFLDTLPGRDEETVRNGALKALHLLLPAGRGRLNDVARHLGLNPRTFQRRLAEEKLDFSDLLNEARRDICVRHLANRSHTILIVSQMTGFSAAGSFTRWFASEFGCTPKQWRARYFARGQTE